MTLFQYAVIYNPSEKEKKNDEKSKIIVDLATVLAHDIAAATLIAGRAIPPEYQDRLERIEVACRPF